MNRRDALHVMTGTVVAGLACRDVSAAEEPTPRKTGVGLVTYCCGHRAASLKRRDPTANLFEPATFLEHCRSLGAGGMQIALGTLDSREAGALQERAAAAGMYVEAIVGLPFAPDDVSRFDAQMRTARQAGALAVRTTIMSGRRYEEFDSLEAFRAAEARGRRALELAAPVAERHRIPLAVENHKDHRNAERVALFQSLSSEYVGACVDTGNSVSLLEDAVETARALSPWARAVHLKDQAVELYDGGFLLADIPLGQGFSDLKQIVAILRRANPAIHFSLELITRDPLKVPCLEEKYWATFPNVPAVALARTLRAVRDGATHNLQYVTSLPPDEQTALEDANVRASLDYARDELAI